MRTGAQIRFEMIPAPFLELYRNELKQAERFCGDHRESFYRRPAFFHFFDVVLRRSFQFFVFFRLAGMARQALGPEPIPERPDQILEHVEGRFDSGSRKIQVKRRHCFNFQVVAHQHDGPATCSSQDEADQAAGRPPQKVERQSEDLLGFAVDGTFELFEQVDVIEKFHQDYLLAVFSGTTYRAWFCFRFEVGDEILFRPYNQRNDGLVELDGPNRIGQIEKYFARKKKRRGPCSISFFASGKSRAPYGKSEAPG